jgi:hypothetical protein
MKIRKLPDPIVSLCRLRFGLSFPWRLGRVFRHVLGPFFTVAYAFGPLRLHLDISDTNLLVLWHDAHVRQAFVAGAAKRDRQDRGTSQEATA